MKKFVIGLCFLVAVINNLSFAQSRLDSLIALRKTDFIAGKIPTYFTPGHQEVAMEYQDLLIDVIEYYERQYSKSFQVKLILLDSAQWLKEVLPYGYVFYGRGWIVVNTGMEYNTFKRVYGAAHYASQLEQAMQAKKVDSQSLIKAVLKFYSIHELGHYFLGTVMDIKSPDAWTGEFSASYFAYEYLKNEEQNVLNRFELFCHVNKESFTPTYRTLVDFNKKYVGVGAENYLWYHSNFYFLIKSLYGCHGKNYIPSFKATFPKGSKDNADVTEIISLLDDTCPGVVQKWVQELERIK